jgi:hypothetical protein
LIAEFLLYNLKLFWGYFFLCKAKLTNYVIHHQ